MRKLHNLDDKLLSTQLLLERIEIESCSGPFKFMVPLSNGRIEIAGPGKDPVWTHRLFGSKIVEYLNHEINYDGAWILIWIKPENNSSIILPDGVSYTEIRILWIDKDGDVQFTVEIDDDLSEMVKLGYHYWVEQCEDAHGHWRHQRKVLDLVDGQSFKHAQGELIN